MSEVHSLLRLRWFEPDAFLFVFTLELDFTFRFLRWLCVDADEAELEESELSEDETTEEELSLEIGGDIFFCASEESMTTVSCFILSFGG